MRFRRLVFRRRLRPGISIDVAETSKLFPKIIVCRNRCARSADRDETEACGKGPRTRGMLAQSEPKYAGCNLERANREPIHVVRMFRRRFDEKLRTVDAKH